MKTDCAKVEREKGIERYLAGSGLSAEETRGLEEHFAGCPKCSEKLAAARSKAAAAGAGGRGAQILWAGLAVVVIGAAIWCFYPGGSPSPSKPGPGALSPTASRATLAAAVEYKPPKYEPAAAPEKDPAAAAFQDAMKAYEGADYIEASKRLRQVIRQHPEYAPAHFYWGASELVQGHASLALQEMNNVLRDKDTPYNAEAEWGFAKASLAHHDFGQARWKLNQIAAGNGQYAGPARELLAQLTALGK